MESVTTSALLSALDDNTSEVTTVPADLNATEEYKFAGAHELLVFHTWYKEIHGYLAVIVCVFGIVANILNIVVLTRKNMISATNCILTGLAVSDGLTMVAYLPFALRFYCLYGTDPTVERNTLSAVRFMLFYACFSVVVHTVSIWLTVTLAVFRYIFIKYPRYGSELCSLWRAKLAVLLVFLVTLIVCVPNFITLNVKGHPPPADVGPNATEPILLWVVQFRLDTPRDEIIYNFNFWVQAILVKLLPCIGLTILSILLVHTMNEAEQRRQNLRNKGAKKTAEKKQRIMCTCFTNLCQAKPEMRNYGGTNNGEVQPATNGVRKDDSSRDRKTNRTTRMLLAVVGLFLLTEFPQGIMNLLSGILPHFVDEVYGPLGDLVDILALINNGINFILYCTMSKQFRDTFIDVFVTPIRCKRSTTSFQPVPTSVNVHDHVQSTHHTDL